jgi:hypothetical protein
MKKILLIMMTFMASFGAFAQEVNTENEISTRGLLVTPYPLLSVVSVNQSDLVLPWTFSIPAPYEAVAEVSGPILPQLRSYAAGNLCTWEVNNGYLTVTILEDAGPEILQKGEYHFVVRTVNSNLYNIVFEVR